MSKLEHSNQVCIATLLALKDYLNDYKVQTELAAEPPQITKLQSTTSQSAALAAIQAANSMPLTREELNRFRIGWNSATSFIRESKRLHEGVLNALEEIERLVSLDDIEDLCLSKI